MASSPRLFPLLKWDRILTGARGFDAQDREFVAEPPVGVRLEIEPARKSEPVLTQDMPWENEWLGFFKLIKEGDLFRLWYRANGVLCYAESADGFAWRRPVLGLSEFQGSTANNRCLHQGHWIEAPGILIDPLAPAAERYKMIYFSGKWEDAHGREISTDEGERQEKAAFDAQRRGENVTAKVRCRTGLFGAVSSDGLRWQELPKPLIHCHCDTHNILAFDHIRKCYVAFLRTAGWRGREIGFTETRDFSTWPDPELILRADIDDPPDVDLYTNAYSPYPDAENLHVMFPTLYHHISDRVDARLAVCHTWRDWSWVERRPAIPLGPAGSDDGGALYPCPDLVRLPGERMGILYWGDSLQHNEPFRTAPPQGRHVYRWALWERDRLAGLRAEADGQFTISLPMPCTGPICLNYRTEPGGWIKAELIREIPYPPRPVKAIPGYAFDECEPLTGNAFTHPLVWKGGEALSPELKGVHLRIRMNRAKIFAFMT